MVFKTNKTSLFLYIFLFTAAFNDLLRIGTSRLSIFRILLPIAMLVAFCSSGKARKVYAIMGLVLIASLAQSLFFCNSNDVGVHFSINRYLVYAFYYLCIASVVAAVLSIVEDVEFGVEDFSRFLSVIGVCYLLVFIYIYYSNQHNISSSLIINNPNDYGAMLTAMFPFFYCYYKEKGRIASLLFIAISLMFLVLNDCKLALLGTIVQVFLLSYFELRNKKPKWKNATLIAIASAFIAFLIFVNNKDFTFHGYSWEGTVVEPIKAMLQGHLYGQSNTSVSYRVNTFIVSMEWLKRTRLVGIGIGNSGFLIRNVLGARSLYLSWLNNTAVSLHNVFLEVLLEFGIIAIIGVALIAKTVIKILGKLELNKYEVMFLTTLISSLLWLQGPSGVLTDYMIVVLFTYEYICMNTINNSRD